MKNNLIINPETRLKFDNVAMIESEDASDIYVDLLKSNIKNVSCDEVYVDLTTVLYEDYIKYRVNYKSYWRNDTNLRVLMELRKSALLNVGLPDEFYLAHNTVNTVEEIKHLRIKYLAPNFVDYADEDWQYYVVLKFSTTREQQEELAFDYEHFFADCDPEHEWPDYLAQVLDKYFAYDINTGERKPPEEYGIYTLARKKIPECPPLEELSDEFVKKALEYVDSFEF